MFFVLVRTLGMVFVVAVVVLLRWPGGHGSRLGSGLLNNFIEFAPVEPDPPALRTIINFNPLPLGHDQINTAHWTLHVQFSFPFLSIAPFLSWTEAKAHLLLFHIVTRNISNMMVKMPPIIIAGVSIALGRFS